MKLGKKLLHEPGLIELMTKNIDNINFMTNYKSAYKDAGVIFMGVGNPEKNNSSANLRNVYSVAIQIAEAIEKFVL
ncbi:hypothetical protein [Priestia aryabhattai]|uniref:hypothetical protein n=1 Tax=Priestia aryabhattai TaxID=412384 RepID=UPI002E21BBE5